MAGTGIKATNYMCASLADDVVFPAPLGPNIKKKTGAEFDACSIDRLGTGLDDASRGRDACKKNGARKRKL